MAAPAASTWEAALPAFEAGTRASGAPGSEAESLPHSSRKLAASAAGSGAPAAVRLLASELSLQGSELSVQAAAMLALQKPGELDGEFQVDWVAWLVWQLQQLYARVAATLVVESAAFEPPDRVPLRRCTLLQPSRPRP